MALKLRVKNRKRENNKLVINNLHKCLGKWDKELYEIRSWSNKEGVDIFFSKEVSKEDVISVRSCLVEGLNYLQLEYGKVVIIGEEEPSYLRYRYRYDRLEKKKEKKKQTTLGGYM
tara:strand:- start:1274 stop:1621 length:348 start_codon:yes stop_codon:yes gene_type:complete